jgi:hypothetical protein
VGRHDESGLDRIVEESEEQVEVAADVEERDGLGDRAELVPCQDLEHFVERAVATRHGDEAVGPIAHPRLARVHGVGDDQLGEAEVGNLPVDQRLRYEARDPPARGERGVGQGAHQSYATATEDEIVATSGDRHTEVDGGDRERRVAAVVGSAEDTDRRHGDMLAADL